MKKFILLIPTMYRTDLLKKCVDSIKTKFEYDLVIVNNWDDDDHIIYCMELEKNGIEVLYFPETRAVGPPYPGVAASWNIALRRVASQDYEYALIANDDIVFKENSIDLMIESADKNSDAGIIFSNYGWSCFLIGQFGIDNIGYFDENFHFAYLEDIDYFHRKELGKIRHETVYETDLDHVGSATIKNNKIISELNNISHGANFDYMKLKWGLERDDVRNLPKSPHPYGEKRYGIKDWVFIVERYWGVRQRRDQIRAKLEAEQS